ncbi:MAG TPA: Crp/Fnr family transcriptional regulator [Rhizomicrobium sp.]|jgi:CRP-like cAMP-binding protein
MERSLRIFLDKLLSRTSLTEMERRAVLSLDGRSERLQAQDSFVRSNDRTKSACLVTEGVCGRIDRARDDRRQITAVYLPGDMADLKSVFQPQATSELEALTAASIVRFPHSQLHQVMRLHPAVGEAFSRYLMDDAANTQEWLVNVGSREAKAAVAHFFCEIAVRLGKAEGKSFSFFFPLSQNQLSEICGISTVHVNRTMMHLRRAQLMQMEHGQVHVADWRGLQALAGFDASYLFAHAQERVAPLPLA